MRRSPEWGAETPGMAKGWRPKAEGRRSKAETTESRRELQSPTFPARGARRTLLAKPRRRRPVRMPSTASHHPRTSPQSGESGECRCVGRP
eukprot:5605093-Prymnesium_polylepis.2